MREYQNLEEQRFAEWCTELHDANYIENWELCKEPYELLPNQSLKWKKQLKTKTKDVFISATRRQTYLPDFRIKWTDKACGVLYTPIEGISKNKGIFVGIGNESFIDVKGTFFGKHDSDVRFSLKQSLFLQVHNKYVEKCSPFSTKKKKGLFEKTFAPHAYLTDSQNYYKRGSRKGTPKFLMLSLEEWIQTLKSQ